MSRLGLYLFGHPRVELNGETVHIGRRKALALLAYLAVTRARHSRDALATLLWPEYDQRDARTDLSRTLSVLNRTLGSGWLTADRDTVGLCEASEIWLDIEAFRRLLAACEAHEHPLAEACRDCLALLTEALELYQDDFMAGFSLPDSLAFDEWQRFQTQALRDELGSALERLCACHGAHGEHELAIAAARRWLELDKLREGAHRQLMALYAQTGRSGAALRQYRACIRVLEEELGAAPSAETTALYERLRAERVHPPEKETPPPAPSAQPRPPGFLSAEEPTVVEREVFVAREPELALLQRHLEETLAGQGRVVFVTGGPGRGKTALTQEFAHRSMQTNPDLLVATGTCNAFSGVGDPYLPFREVLVMLAGDVEAHWAAGSISRDHARRLWEALPLAAQALLDHGPYLINTLLPGPALLFRATAAAVDGPDWLTELRGWVQRETSANGGLEQSAIFQQFSNVLRALAERQPLLVVLDDLQWADSGSISLLFHLARGLANAESKLLIVGTYRPEEVALGRDSARHPLGEVLPEFKRHFGDVWVDLTQADEKEGRRFVEAFLDAEPNRLGADFRQRMFEHTEGHPLFTVELLLAMQERGDLVQDTAGHWIQGAALNWQALPARVEAVIETRVNRLDEELREILAVASIEGETFTAQVVAQVQDIPQRHLIQRLVNDLGKRHGLIGERGVEKLDGQRLYLYRFRHHLFQHYLYRNLSEAERELLHGEVAAVLEALYGGQTHQITVQLAHHYLEAGQSAKAVDYLLRAGDQARVVYAHNEAVEHYQRALVFLKEQGDHERAARTLMKLGSTHHIAFDFPRAHQAYDEGFALWQRVGEIVPTVPLPPAPHPLKVNWLNPITLDPAKAGKPYFLSAVIDQLFSGLVELTPELDVVPGLARTWELLEGGRKYLFHLRDDVRWSDGTPLTAGDVAYAWKRVLDPATESPVAILLYDVKGARSFHQGEMSDPDHVGVRAPDETTLIVELEEPTSYFLHLLAHSVSYPVPRHTVEQHGETWAEIENIVTSGPFRLEKWSQDESMLLVRNPDYSGRFTGNLQQVELSLVPDWSGQLGVYADDGLDVLWLGLVPVPDRERARRHYSEDYISAPFLSIWYAELDVSRPPFDDVRVRRAFVLAIDKEALAGVHLWGISFPATGGFVPSGMPGHSAGIGLPFDPDQARQLMAEAGYPGGSGFPDVHALVGRDDVRNFEYLQAQWRENLGVEVTRETVDMVMLFNQIERELPHILLAQLWVADYPDPDDFLRVGLRQYPTGWRQETYDELIDQARRVTDQRERMRMYQEADRILINEAPVIPMLYGRLKLLVKPWVRKYPTTAIKLWFWKDVIIEPH